MIKALDHLNIVVNDLPAAQKFFERLGFKSLDSGHLSGEWISSIVGLPNVDADYVALRHPGSPTNIELIHYRNPPSGDDANKSAPHQLGYRHIAFSVEDIDEFVKDLAGEVTFLSPVNVYPKTGKKLVYFLGPEGLVMEFAQYP